MGDFNRKAGETNLTGDIGTPANMIAPGKTMLSSMTPTMVTKDGRLVLLTGSPGGRTIINTVFTIVLGVTEYGLNGRQAVDLARMHHQWLPDRATLEDGAVPEDVLSALRAMGHESPRTIAARRCAQHLGGARRHALRRAGQADARLEGVSSPAFDTDCGGTVGCKFTCFGKSLCTDTGTTIRTATAGRSSSARNNPKRKRSTEFTRPRRTTGEAFLLYGLYKILCMNFSKLDGLIPAVIQDDGSNEVLMVGFMNQEALDRTVATGFATFFSRTRGKLWMKGETSGNRLRVERILVDCDEDTVLVRVTRLGDGNVCHTGAERVSAVACKPRRRKPRRLGH